MPVIVQGIESDVGEAKPLEMLGLLGNFGGEYEAIGGDAARLGLPTQIGLHHRFFGRQPKNASRHGTENPHPGAERRGIDLVALVEGTEHD